MREYKVIFKHNGVGYEAYVHNDLQIEEVEHDNPQKLQNMEDCLVLISNIVDAMKKNDFHNVEVIKL